jgi:hypothetical protein
VSECFTVCWSSICPFYLVFYFCVGGGHIRQYVKLRDYLSYNEFNVILRFRRFHFGFWTIKKKCMTLKCIGDYQDLDQDLGKLCCSNKFDLNAGKRKSISFLRNMRLIEFVYLINGTTFKRVDEIKDLGVIWTDEFRFCTISRQLSPNHRERWILLSVFVKSFMYTHKTLNTSVVRPKLEHAACVWSPNPQFILSGWSERNTISFVMRCVDCRGECGRCRVMCKMPSNRSWGALRYENCRQCSLCAGGSVVRFVRFVLLLRFDLVPDSRRRA